MNRTLVCIWTVVVVLTASGTSVTFFGGAGRVGGSCALVERDARRVLVDCGSLYSEEVAGGGRDKPGFAFDPRGIDDVLVTHAHQDHAGRVPELIRAGFGGTVWMTAPTRELLSIVWRTQVMYEDGALPWRWTRRSHKKGRMTVHWRDDCEWLGKIAKENLCSFTGPYREIGRQLETNVADRVYVGLCATCQQLELDAVLKHVRVVDFDREVRIGPFGVVFRPVKHLPGAAAVAFSDGESRFVFSGDLGTLRSRLTEKIDPAEKADAVFVECTYGDASYGDAQTAAAELLRFQRTVGETVKAGGLAWIPAFALDRSQRVLIEIAEGMKAGLIGRDVPVYYLSPSSRQMAQAYVEHPGWFDNGSVAGLAELLPRSRKSFNAKKSAPGAGILLTTSGMMDAGYSLSYLPDLAQRTNVTVCLVGYQAPGTHGNRLKRGAKVLKVTDGGERKTVEVNCRVEDFACFSGHGDAREIERWLANNWQSKIYLVHGDRKSLDARRQGLRERFHADVEIAEPGRKYDIITRTSQCQQAEGVVK